MGLNILNLNEKNSSGIYSGLHSQVRYFFFQNPTLDPPCFPPPRRCKLEWDEIISVDDKNIIIYLNNLTKIKERARPNERVRPDDIDIYDNVTSSSAKVAKMAIEDGKKIVALEPLSLYWDSPEAFRLFKPKEGESVIECLSRRDRILSAGPPKSFLLSKAQYNNKM